MKCPFCDSKDNQVLESRTVEDGGGIRRRRECNKCNRRFTTYERVNGSVLWVIKKDGTREMFDKNKLKGGILMATQKRPVSVDQINEIVDQVEREMLRAETEEVETKKIGSAVLKRLRKTDKVAWLRFASVYMEFKDTEDFEKAIGKLLN